MANFHGYLIRIHLLLVYPLLSLSRHGVSISLCGICEDGDWQSENIDEQR